MVHSISSLRIRSRTLFIVTGKSKKVFLKVSWNQNLLRLLSLFIFWNGCVVTDFIVQRIYRSDFWPAFHSFIKMFVTIIGKILVDNLALLKF